MRQTQTALITGGAQRIGAQVASYLHGAGFNVLIHCNRSRVEAEAKADQLNALRPNSAGVIQADLGDEQSLGALADEVNNEYPDLSVLVNNASVFFPATFESTTREQWQLLQITNAEAPYFLSQALATRLAGNQGAIVNVTDIYASIPLRNYSAYCASKAALLSTTRSLALELAPKVRVNAVAPGAIFWPESHAGNTTHETDSNPDSNAQEFSADMKQNMLQRIPLGRLGEAEDIAKLVLFLVQDAPYITGQVINVDGGRSLSA